MPGSFTNSAVVVANQQATAAQYNGVRKDAIINAGDYVVSTGGTNAFVVAIDSQVASITNGFVCKFLANFSNTSTATLVVNGLSAKEIKKRDGAGLKPNDISSGNVAQVIYDGTNFQLMTPPSPSAIFFFGDGSDGDVTIAADTTPTRDMFYRNLTIATTKTLFPNGWRIHVSGLLTYQGTGKIAAFGGNGGVGGNGANSAGGNTAGASGAAGAQANTAGTLQASAPGNAGGAGGQGSGGGVCGGGPSNGTAGQSFAKAMGVSGVAGGVGGNSNANDCLGPGTAGAAGTITGSMLNSISHAFVAYNPVDFIPTTTMFFVTAGSGSGGGGQPARNDGAGGGGGGGSGAPGGIVWVAAYSIITVAATDYIDVHGGNGGNGGNGAAGGSNQSGGGGGGGAGSGGKVILIYSYKTGTGTINVSGGTKGTKGTGGAGSPNNATDGTNGIAGSSTLIQI